MMFSRNEQTYDGGDDSVDATLADPANSLCQIAEMIARFDGIPAILDIGAGNGLLSLLVARRSESAIIDGIESNSFAAELAAPHYRNFYRGSAHEFLEVIQANQYDFIVLADVIEHMADPLEFLRDLNSHVSGSTRIILSTPNVAFGSVRVGLMNGEFRYVDSGLLERTHLRFFTYETLVELVRQSGFYSLQTLFLKRDILKTEIDISTSLRNLLYLLSIRNDELSHVYQFLVVLGKDREAQRQTEPIRVGRPSRIPVDFFARFWSDLKRTGKRLLKS
jgi:2-polyprenyl-3-methyl-5-hydroxy-6-metoxy-1,4-benzoquinol methylase